MVIFALTYLAIAGQGVALLRIDRPAAALLGAIAMVTFGGIPLDDAFALVDLKVIGLLLGVMIIASYLEEAHFFRFAAWWILTRAQTPRSLLYGLVFVAGTLSALLLNDTVCVVLAPLVLAVALEAGLPPLPFLLALSSATNVGGVVSFSGNPQNMLIGQAAAGDPGYGEYLLLALPVGVAALVTNALLLTAMFRHQLGPASLPARSAPKPYLDRPLTARAIAALLLFVGLALFGIGLAGAALCAAALLMVSTGKPTRLPLGRVDWPLLLFFAALFTVVGGLARAGGVAAVASWIPHLGAPGLVGDLWFTGTTVVGSNVVSNVPFVLVALEWVSTFDDPRWGYILLAVVSTLAGNLTMLGSVANLIVFDAAGQHGKIGFFRFLSYGAILTLGTLSVALAVLWTERSLGW